MPFYAGQKYYLRTRHRSLNGKVSLWSPGSEFTTEIGPEELLLIPSGAGQGYLVPTDISVDEGENWIMLGCGRSPLVDVNSGTEFLFRKVGGVWNQHAALPPPEGTSHRGTNFQYGYVSKINALGTYSILGGPGNSQGIIYLQLNSSGSWNNITNNRGSGYAAGNRLGQATDSNADSSVIFAGAPLNTNGATNSGAFSIWTRTSNTLTHRVRVASMSPSVSGGFGEALSCNRAGTSLAVGQPLDDANGTNSGKVFIYGITGGGTGATGQTTLQASDPEANAEFGSRLSLNKNSNVTLDGTVLVVGSYKKDDGGTDSGAAYVFTRPSGGSTSWDTGFKLTNPTQGAGVQFGFSVAVSSDGQRVAIGAPGYNGNRGIVHVYQRTTGNNWVLLLSLSASDAAANAYFGYAVAISADGARVYVGSPGRKDGSSASKGACYVYTLNT